MKIELCLDLLFWQKTATCNSERNTQIESHNPSLFLVTAIKYIYPITRDNAFSFLKYTQETPNNLTCEIRGAYCQFKVWLVFYLYWCSVLCNIMLYWIIWLQQKKNVPKAHIFNWVSKMVDDGLVPIWHQGICIHPVIYKDTVECRYNAVQC